MQFPSGQCMKALSRDLRYLRSIPAHAGEPPVHG